MKIADVIFMPKKPGKIPCSKGYLFQKNLQEIYEY